eukprot:403342_1
MSTHKKIIHCRSCSALVIRRGVVNGKCRKCVLSWERNRIGRAIHETHDFFDVKAILELIVDYSMGYTVKCCNSKCDNIINIKNYYDLCIKFNKYCYSINSKYITCFNKQYFHKIYGKYRRTACRKCIFGKRVCRNNCSNKDPEFNVCWNHPHCYICNIPKYKRQYFVYTKCCEFCNRYYCTIHGLKQQKICKNCELSILFNQTKKTIINVIENIFVNRNKVIDIIAYYSYGYTIKCCNDLCKEIICINSRTDYENMIDANNRKFYHYKINKYYLQKPQLQKTRKFYLLFDEETRCFCSDCNAKKLKMCYGCVKIAKYESGETRRVLCHYLSCDLFKKGWRTMCNCNSILQWQYKDIWNISWKQCKNKCLKEEKYCMNHKLIKCIQCENIRDEYYIKYKNNYDYDINGWILYCDICNIYICGKCANYGLFDENRKLNNMIKYKKCKHVFGNEKIGQYSFQNNAHLLQYPYKYLVNQITYNDLYDGYMAKYRWGSKVD